MSLKNIILALGIGMVCIGTLLMFVNGQRGSELSDAEIKRRAEMLGMVEPNKKDAILTSELEDLEKNTEDIDTKKDTDGEKEKDLKEEDNQNNQELDLQGNKADNPTENGEVSDDKKIGTDETSTEKNSDKNTSKKANENTDNKASEKKEDTSSDKKTSGKKNEDANSSKKTSNKKTSENKKTNTKKKDTKKQQTEEEKKETITVKINSGMTAGEICQKLQEEGLVEDAEDFRKYLVEKNIQRKLQAGTFEIANNADYDEIVSAIYRG